MPNSKVGKPTFEVICSQLPALLEELLACVPSGRSSFADAPPKGIYLFQEGRRYLYIGRTNRMRKRLAEHGSASSSHYSASFAYRLAKEEAQTKGLAAKMSRLAFCCTPPYNEMFLQAKARVASMQVSYVKIDDPHVQTIFEVYASLKLNTPYNHFDPT